MLLLLLGIGAPATASPFVHRSGRTIVDGSGRSLQLRGVNLGGWLHWEGWLFGAPLFISQGQVVAALEQAAGAQSTRQFAVDVRHQMIGEDDIAAIAALGCNVVRVPLSARQLAATDSWEVLDRLLGWCERHHVYVVLDMHGPSGGLSRSFTSDPPVHGPPTFWKSASDQDAAGALWERLARRYRNRAIVGGYDVLNEPDPHNGRLLMEVYRKLVARIRSADRNHLVFLEGDYLGLDPTFLERIDDNQALSPHVYSFLGDHRGETLAKWDAASARCDCPLWVGELGEEAPERIDSSLSMIESASGWCYWTWKRAPATAPGLRIVQLPRSWKRLMRWVGHPRLARRPSEAEARQAMADFLRALPGGDDSSPMFGVLRKHLPQPRGYGRSGAMEGGCHERWKHQR